MNSHREQMKMLVVEDCSGRSGHRKVAHCHVVNALSLPKWVAAYQAIRTVGLKSKNN